MGSSGVSLFQCVLSSTLFLIPRKSGERGGRNTGTHFENHPCCRSNEFLLFEMLIGEMVEYGSGRRVSRTYAVVLSITISL